MPNKNMTPVQTGSKGYRTGSKDSKQKSAGSKNPRETQPKPRSTLRNSNNGKSDPTKKNVQVPGNGKGNQREKYTGESRSKDSKERKNRSQDSAKDKGKTSQIPNKGKPLSAESIKNQEKDNQAPGDRGDQKYSKNSSEKKDVKNKTKSKKKKCCRPIRNLCNKFKNTKVFKKVLFPTFTLLKYIFYDPFAESLKTSCLDYKGIFTRYKHPEVKILPYIYAPVNPEDSHRYSQSVKNCFYVITVFMTILGRWPVIIRRSYRTEKIEFWYKRLSFTYIYFSLVHYFFQFTSLLLFTGICSYLFEIPRLKDRPWKPVVVYQLEERYFFVRNAFPMFITLFMYFNVIAGTCVFHDNYRYLAHYMNNWVATIHTLTIEVTKDAQIFSVFFYPVYFLIFAFQCYLCYVRPIPMIGGQGAVIAWMGGRFLNNTILDNPSFPHYRNLGIVFYMIIQFAARIYVLIYLFIVRMHMRTWIDFNDKLQRILFHSNNRDLKNKIMSAWGLNHLYKEFALIASLMESTDIMFKGIVETFFYSCITNIVLEFYYIHRCLTQPLEFPPVRRRDYIFMSTLLVSDLLMFTVLASSTSFVYMSGTVGAYYAMRQGYFRHRTYCQRLFVHSLLRGYNTPFPLALSGGGHFWLTRNFVFSMMTFVGGCILMFLQMSPSCQIDMIESLEVQERLYLNPYKRQFLQSWWENTTWTETAENHLTRTIEVVRPFRNLSELGEKDFVPNIVLHKYYAVYDDYDPYIPEDIEDGGWGPVP